MIEFFVNKLLIICYLCKLHSITEHTSQNRVQRYNFFSKLPNIWIIKISTSYKLHLTQQKNHSADDTDNHLTSYIELMLT